MHYEVRQQSSRANFYLFLFFFKINFLNYYPISYIKTTQSR